MAEHFTDWGLPLDSEEAWIDYQASLSQARTERSCGEDAGGES